MNFLTEQELAERLRLSVDTLQRYRRDGVLQRGVHWQKLRGGEVRYNEELINDWWANLHDPDAHQRAIEVWQSQLLSNRKKKLRRIQ
jgi:predicted site-specific integrase-resolvase